MPKFTKYFGDEIENGKDREKGELKGDVKKGRGRDKEDEKGGQHQRVKKISLTTEEDRKKEDDDHDRGPNHRDPSPLQ